MAAAGGGLRASAVAAGVNTCAAVRCRFPARPWTSRSLLKTEKRSRVGRVRVKDRKRPGLGPVNVGAALREDPSLSRLLLLAERRARQGEAGFCTSGSDEDEEFTGFKADSRWPSHSSQRSSNLTAVERAAVSSSLSDKPSVRDRHDSQTDQISVRPKMVLKITARKMTKQEVEQQLKRPSLATGGHLKQGISKNDRVLRGQKDERSKHQRSPTEHAETSETNQYHRKRRKEITGDAQTGTVSPKLLGKQTRTHKDIGSSLEAGQELAVSPDEEAETSLSFKRFRKRRKCSFGRRSISQQKMLPKIRNSQGQTSEMPRTKQRLGGLHSKSACHALQQEERDIQPFKKMERSSSGGQAEEPDHFARPVVSGRSSRVIRVPKRFMDDERISALPDKGSLKKPGALTEVPLDSDSNDFSNELDSRQKISRELQMMKDTEMNFPKKRSQGTKPLLSSSGVTGGSHGRGGRFEQSVDYKIYWKLKKLTASLAQQKMQRIVGASTRVLGEDAVKKGTRDVEEPAEFGRRKKTDPKMQDVCSPGVVPKLAVHVGQRFDQSALASLAEGCEPAIENVENTKLEDTDEQIIPGSDHAQMMEQSGTAHRMNLTGASKRMFHMLKKARVQLIKIDQQKPMKSAQLQSGPAGEASVAVVKRGRRRRKRSVKGNAEDAPQKHAIGGPRIKHVCRAAAVALGKPRAMVPDNIPRLSALPLHERERITASPAEEDVASHSEPESDASVEQKPVFRRKYETTAFGRRLNRCSRCKGCNRLEDCGTCVFCLDRPKFGGPNKKRQSYEETPAVSSHSRVMEMMDRLLLACLAPPGGSRDDRSQFYRKLLHCDSSDSEHMAATVTVSEEAVNREGRQFTEISAPRAELRSSTRQSSHSVKSSPTTTSSPSKM